MASDSDVSAITLSDDDNPKPQKPTGGSKAAAGGKLQAAKAAAPSSSGTGSRPSKQQSRRKGRRRVQFVEEEDDGGSGDGEVGHRGGDGNDDAGAEGAAAVEDQTKPLGWSYFRKRDASEGPATWQEVDEEELRFVAESLVRSSTAHASPADGVIQQIFQTTSGAEDSLLADPLGRGYIDPVTLEMTRDSRKARAVQPGSSGKGLKATMRTFRTARLGGKGEPADSGPGPSQADAEEDTEQVLPNQEGFNPEAYLARFHADASMSQLERGLRSLGSELSERTGQLKMLIRNNFDRFINCKDAIDDIHLKLQKMLVPSRAAGATGAEGAAPAHTATQGVGPDRVVKSLEQVDGQARRTFGDILERAAKADRIRSVSSLLQRFNHLFAAPQRVLDLAARGELNQVVREYRRANTSIRPTPTSARVWVSLYAEIEKRVTDVYLAVRQLVTAAPPESGVSAGQGGGVDTLGTGAMLAPASGAGQERLQQLPDYLLFMALLRQERLPAARDEDAMRMYVNKVEAHVEERIKECDQRHAEELGRLVTAWMKANPAVAAVGAVVPSTALQRVASTSAQVLQASIASMLPAAAGNAGAASGAAGAAQQQRRQGGEDDVSELDVDDDVELEEEDEGAEAEALFLLWQGTAENGEPFPALPPHLRAGAQRLVQDPGGPATLVDGTTVAVSDSAVGLLPASAHAPAPVLTCSQQQWVSYICALSAVLLWAVPGLWSTCNSPKYGNDAELEGQAREGLERGPSLGRRLVESLCGKYAQRLKRAAQSLARAGPMQPGLPLLIQDTCHLWGGLRRVGCSSRVLRPLRGAVLGVLGSHCGVLSDHLAELPQLLFETEDFRLDLFAADQQPVTALPRRLEEELGVALAHYLWPLQAVVEAAGGAMEVPPDSSWRPVQAGVFGCFSLLIEALAEYARGLYGTGGGAGEEDDGAGGASVGSARAGRSRQSLDAASSSRGAGLSPTQSSRSTGSLAPQGGGGSALDYVDVATRGSVLSGSGSRDVRVLLVISNSAVIRSRIMPGVVERHRRLLAPTHEAAATCQRRLRDLTASMRRSNEALGSSWLARKEAAIKESVRAYVAAEAAAPLPSLPGTAEPGGAEPTRARKAARVGAEGGGRLLPGPAGPSAGCSALLQLLTSIHNEALAYSPSNLRSFMEALAEHAVDQLSRACSGFASGSGHEDAATNGGREGRHRSRQRAAAGGGSVEQMVQLWADLAFLGSVLRPLLTANLAADMQAAKADIGAAISARQRPRRYCPLSSLAEALVGLADGESVSEALEELLAAELESWRQRYALNVRCFAAASLASPLGPTASFGGASSSSAGAGPDKASSGGAGVAKASAAGPVAAGKSTGLPVDTALAVAFDVAVPAPKAQRRRQRREQRAEVVSDEEDVEPAGAWKQRLRREEDVQPAGAWKQHLRPQAEQARRR